jgi:hypothetical protein
MQRYIKVKGAENIKIIYFKQEPDFRELLKQYENLFGNRLNIFDKGFTIRADQGEEAIEFIFK